MCGFEFRGAWHAMLVEECLFTYESYLQKGRRYIIIEPMTQTKMRDDETNANTNNRFE
jgi:hypothetical protein